MRDLSNSDVAIFVAQDAINSETIIVRIRSPILCNESVQQTSIAAMTLMLKSLSLIFIIHSKSNLHRE